MIRLRNTLYTVLCLLTGTCILSGCIEEYEADIPADDSNLLVVEGTICSARENTFILSRTQSLKAYYAPDMVRGATVSVRGSDGSEYRAQAADGCYTCWIDRLEPDVEYCLHIETDGEVYESVPQKPLPTDGIENIWGVQSTSESPVDVLITTSVPVESGKVNYYSWTYDETWEVRPEYTTAIYFNPEKRTKVDTVNVYPERGWKDATCSTTIIGSSTNYEGQQIRNLKIYDISRSNERLYYRYSGLVHQRAISKAEYEYELARRQADTEMGGLFTPQPSALPTNIRCLTSGKRVIGYVGCSLNTSEYRFFLNAREFSNYTPPQGFCLELEDCTEDDCCLMVESGMFLIEWEDTRYSQESFFHRLRTVWTYAPQLDVRLRGAYIEEPEFWSLNENIGY